MITGTLKNRMDQLWTEFWTGGVTNPLTVIEQISYLMFIRMMDLTETRREKAAARTGKPHKGLYSGPDDAPLAQSHSHARRPTPQDHRPGGLSSDP